MEVTKKDLAEITGMSRQTVSKRLEGLSFCDQKKKLYDSAEALKRIYEQGKVVKEVIPEMVTVSDLTKVTGLGLPVLRKKLSSVRSEKGKYRLQSVMPYIYGSEYDSENEVLSSAVNSKSQPVSDYYDDLDDYDDVDDEEFLGTELSIIEAKAFTKPYDTEALKYLCTINHRKDEALECLREKALNGTGDTRLLIYLHKIDQGEKEYTSDGVEINEEIKEKMKAVSLKQFQLLRSGRRKESDYLAMSVDEILEEGTRLGEMSEEEFREYLAI